MTPGEIWIMFAVIVAFAIWTASTPPADESEYPEWWK